MSGSVIGNRFKIMTWGESHGAALGVTIDGCPAGLLLSSEDIQKYLDLRRPGQSKMTTQRSEKDKVEILSGVFEGMTTGTPISLMIKNEDQHSKDYSNIADKMRPGHADYGFTEKYGFRDYRGGGRSSGRETIARVAAGAVAIKILEGLGISIVSYTSAIGPVKASSFDEEDIMKNPLFMADLNAAKEAEAFVKNCVEKGDSVGGIIETKVFGMPPGIGEPVFGKLDASLAQAMLSIGAVKGFEIGDGFKAAEALGSENNDEFMSENGHVIKKTNHSGGVLGGMSDGSDIFFKVAIKPTPSISKEQNTVNDKGENVSLVIKGRHDPVIVPRAVIVVKSMCALILLDALMENMTSRISYLEDFYGKK
ncbi:MAG: chorismate synthase [Lachnospiraceae bacterium]|nr:chorismate synthase [Lachnospiraceae bacterium]